MTQPFVMPHNSPPVFDTNMNLWQSRESNYSFLRVSLVHGYTVMTLAQSRENTRPPPQFKLQISLEFVRLTQNVSNFVKKMWNVLQSNWIPVFHTGDR